MFKKYTILAGLFIVAQTMFGSNNDELRKQALVNEITRLSAGIINTNSRQEVDLLVLQSTNNQDIRHAFSIAREGFLEEPGNPCSKQVATQKINQLKGFHFQNMELGQVQGILTDIYGVIFCYFRGLNQ